MPSYLIEHKELRQLAFRAFVALGSEAAEATIVSDHLVEANLAGHDSHGVGLLPMYLKDRQSGMVKANQHARLERSDGFLGMFTGAMGHGQVIVGEALAWGIDKAKAGGVSIVAIREAYHIGRVGAYSERAAAEGLISIIFVNVVGGPPVVAPFGGTDGRLHTNPIAIGVPARENEATIILDFATSRLPVGKVRVALAEERQVAPGTLLDASGAPTDDPAALFATPRGFILPFGEHKGYGLGLMCEILAGALTGSRSNVRTDGTERMTNGVLALLIDPGRFTELSAFHDQVAATIAHVRASPPARRGEPVLVAGDPERRARATRLAAGIPIDEWSWQQVRDAAAAVGVA